MVRRQCLAQSGLYQAEMHRHAHEAKLFAEFMHVKHRDQFPTTAEKLREVARDGWTEREEELDRLVQLLQDKGSDSQWVPPSTPIELDDNLITLQRVKAEIDRDVDLRKAELHHWKSLLAQYRDDHPDQLDRARSRKKKLKQKFDNSVQRTGDAALEESIDDEIKAHRAYLKRCRLNFEKASTCEVQLALLKDVTPKHLSGADAKEKRSRSKDKHNNKFRKKRGDSTTSSSNTAATTTTYSSSSSSSTSGRGGGANSDSEWFSRPQPQQQLWHSSHPGPSGDPYALANQVFSSKNSAVEKKEKEKTGKWSSLKHKLNQLITKGSKESESSEPAPGKLAISTAEANSPTFMSGGTRTGRAPTWSKHHVSIGHDGSPTKIGRHNTFRRAAQLADAEAERQRAEADKQAVLANVTGSTKRKGKKRRGDSSSEDDTTTTTTRTRPTTTTDTATAGSTGGSRGRSGTIHVNGTVHGPATPTSTYTDVSYAAVVDHLHGKLPLELIHHADHNADSVHSDSLTHDHEFNSPDTPPPLPPRRTSPASDIDRSRPTPMPPPRSSSTPSPNPSNSSSTAKDVTAALRSELEPKIRSQLRAELESELFPAVKDELRQSLHGKVRAQVEAQLRSSLGPPLKQELKQELEPLVKSELEEALTPTIKDTIREQLENDLKKELEQKIRAELLNEQDISKNIGRTQLETGVDVTDNGGSSWCGATGGASSTPVVGPTAKEATAGFLPTTTAFDDSEELRKDHHDDNANGSSIRDADQNDLTINSGIEAESDTLKQHLPFLLMITVHDVKDIGDDRAITILSNFGTKLLGTLRTPVTPTARRTEEHGTVTYAQQWIVLISDIKDILELQLSRKMEYYTLESQSCNDTDILTLSTVEILRYVFLHKIFTLESPGWVNFKSGGGIALSFSQSCATPSMDKLGHPYKSVDSSTANGLTSSANSSHLARAITPPAARSYLTAAGHDDDDDMAVGGSSPTTTSTGTTTIEGASPPVSINLDLSDFIPHGSLPMEPNELAKHGFLPPTSPDSPRTGDTRRGSSATTATLGSGFHLAIDVPRIPEKKNKLPLFVGVHDAILVDAKYEWDCTVYVELGWIPGTNGEAYSRTSLTDVLDSVATWNEGFSIQTRASCIPIFLSERRAGQSQDHQIGSGQLPLRSIRGVIWDSPTTSASGGGKTEFTERVRVFDVNDVTKLIAILTLTIGTDLSNIPRGFKELSTIDFDRHGTLPPHSHCEGARDRTAISNFLASRSESTTPLSEPTVFTVPAIANTDTPHTATTSPKRSPTPSSYLRLSSDYSSTGTRSASLSRSSSVGSHHGHGHRRHSGSGAPLTGSKFRPSSTYSTDNDLTSVHTEHAENQGYRNSSSSNNHVFMWPSPSYNYSPYSRNYSSSHIPVSPVKAGKEKELTSNGLQISVTSVDNLSISKYHSSSNIELAMTVRIGKDCLFTRISPNVVVGKKRNYCSGAVTFAKWNIEDKVHFQLIQAASGTVIAKAVTLLKGVVNAFQRHKEPHWINMRDPHNKEKHVCAVFFGIDQSVSISTNPVNVNETTATSPSASSDDQQLNTNDPLGTPRADRKRHLSKKSKKPSPNSPRSKNESDKAVQFSLPKHTAAFLNGSPDYDNNVSNNRNLEPKLLGGNVSWGEMDIHLTKLNAQIDHLRDKSEQTTHELDYYSDRSPSPVFRYSPSAAMGTAGIGGPHSSQWPPYVVNRSYSPYKHQHVTPLYHKHNNSHAYVHPTTTINTPSPPTSAIPRSSSPVIGRGYGWDDRNVQRKNHENPPFDNPSPTSSLTATPQYNSPAVTAHHHSVISPIVHTLPNNNHISSNDLQPSKLLTPPHSPLGNNKKRVQWSGNSLDDSNLTPTGWKKHSTATSSPKRVRASSPLITTAFASAHKTSLPSSPYKGNSNTEIASSSSPNSSNTTGPMLRSAFLSGADEHEPSTSIMSPLKKHIKSFGFDARRIMSQFGDNLIKVTVGRTAHLHHKKYYITLKNLFERPGTGVGHMTKIAHAVKDKLERGDFDADGRISVSFERSPELFLDLLDYWQSGRVLLNPAKLVPLLAELQHYWIPTTCIEPSLNDVQRLQHFISKSSTDIPLNSTTTTSSSSTHSSPFELFEGGRSRSPSLMRPRSPLLSGAASPTPDPSRLQPNSSPPRGIRSRSPVEFPQFSMPLSGIPVWVVTMSYYGKPQLRFVVSNETIANEYTLQHNVAVTKVCIDDLSPKVQHHDGEFVHAKYPSTIEKHSSHAVGKKVYVVWDNAGCCVYGIFSSNSIAMSIRTINKDAFVVYECVVDNVTRPRLYP